MTLNELIAELEDFRILYGGDTPVKIYDPEIAENGLREVRMGGSFRLGRWVELHAD